MNANDVQLATILQTQGNIEHYHVPKYQREYTWGKNEWEQLLQDIEENEIGYFMGSIICIDDNKELAPGVSPIFEVVDGQQRLTTISILMMAIYKAYQDIDTTNMDEDDEEYEEYRLTISNIRKQLIHKKTSVVKTETGYFKEKDKFCFLRIQPSTQRNNYHVWILFLHDIFLVVRKE